MNSKNIVLVLLAISFVLHIKMATSGNMEIAGPFMVTPKKGYVWSDTYKKNSRFYFSNIQLMAWRVGMLNPPYHVLASPVEGLWLPLPGYKFLNYSGDLPSLQTVWTPGVLHPFYKAWASEKEGAWVPVVGYKFVMNTDGWSDVVWDAGQHNDQLKIIAAQTKDQYLAYPGYTFTDPSKNLQVKWTAGVVNPENPNYISDFQEGQWKLKDQDPEQTTTGAEQPTKGHGILAILKWVTGATAESVLGDGEVSRHYTIEGWKELFRGLSN